MQVIRVSEKNLEEIQKDYFYKSAGSPDLDVYLAAKAPWYYIAGWYNESRGNGYPSINVISQFRLDQIYEYDRVKAQAEFTTIVYK